MLSSIPLYAPMFASTENPVPINPTSIEAVTMQLMQRTEIAEPEATLQGIEAVTMQYLQLGVEPPALESTVFGIETLFMQYLERA